MSLMMKYGPVVDLCRQLGTKELSTSEEVGGFKLNALAKTQYQKDILWDKIKEIGGEQPADITADIKVEFTDYYHVHTVERGDTLGAISKQYLGNVGRYMEIFNLNRDQLSNPDLIKIGQDLKIPFK